ncbi:Hydrolase, alpha/beta fold family protein, At1g52510/AT4G12830 homolog 2 [hydrothermal vent metagenome]|uniref:Hydrolase, alpha/beta fold family protein, At1g52510/AT4G12830 homolog 2 n=1 Tax=hydrothermal vent metagenome TaxID=652676 RepID=A0A3B1A748_9ZZZZ
MRLTFFSLLVFLLSGHVTAGDYKLPHPVINDNLTYSLSRVDVLDSTMSYIDTGKGKPVLFIHGNPTSSYLWRNVIPYVSKQNRAIAIDLIGMGQSGKPDIDYSYQDHYRYLNAFINKLGLTDITLVVHDWGAGLGFNYARLNPNKVKAIAFMEGVLPPIFPQPSFKAMGKDMGGMFRALKDPVQGKEMVFNKHLFVEKILPDFVNRTLSPGAMKVYREPYPQTKDRKPILAWPRAIPIAGEPEDNVVVMNEIKKYMLITKTPMLLMYASPGVLVNQDVKNWYAGNIKNIETVYIGQGMHYIQEDHPDAIGRAIQDWMRRH